MITVIKFNFKIYFDFKASDGSKIKPIYKENRSQVKVKKHIKKIGMEIGFRTTNFRFPSSKLVSFPISQLPISSENNDFYSLLNPPRLPPPYPPPPPPPPPSPKLFRGLGGLASDTTSFRPLLS